MTRKHFEAIAAAIAQEARIAPDPAAFFQTRMVASSIASSIAQFNPNFDREKFMDACGVR